MLCPLRETAETWPWSTGHRLLRKPTWGIHLPQYLCPWLIESLRGHRKWELRMLPSEGNPSDGVFYPLLGSFRHFGGCDEGDSRSAQRKSWSHRLLG